MRICLIGPAPPLRGGIAHYNAQLAAAFAGRHQVTLISFSRQYPSLLFPGQTQFEPTAQAPAMIAEALIDSMNPLSWLRTGARIADLSPDLTVVHWWNPFFGPCLGTTIRLAKRRAPAPVAFICHNITPHEWFPAARRLTAFALAPGDAWLVHSEADRRDLESLRVRGPILKIPHPQGRGFGDLIDSDEAKARLGLSGPTLLFFGLIRRYKGLSHLLEALPLVLRKLDCTLLVVGEFYERKRVYVKRIDELGIASKVRIIDRFVPDREVGLYFSAADLVVLPYESATQSAVIQIAFDFARPVLATRVGGLPEAVRDGETGMLVEPRNPTALADAIIRYYEEKMEATLRRRLLQRQPFPWERLAETLEAVAATPRAV
jgi:glycosyltransferase involved in cell wall biosynthesis